MDDGQRTTRLVVLSVLGVIALLVGGGLYLASFPDGEHRGPPPYVPSAAERAFADDPTPEELAEGDLPAPRELEEEWPSGVDCDLYGRIATARDVYQDVVGDPKVRRRRRPSASLDLGAVRVARDPNTLCVAWVARRPPRVPMVIDLEMRELPATAAIWAVRITLEPRGKRFVSVSWPGLGFRTRPAHLDIVRRYGRLVLEGSSLPHRLPAEFSFQVVSRSELLSGGRSFLDCVPDAVRLGYPAGTADRFAGSDLCTAQP
jgi:hypothetical protein